MCQTWMNRYLGYDIWKIRDEILEYFIENGFNFI